MKAVIGIISYLPNDAGKRRSRKAKLNKLIKQCNSIFNKLPIMIIAQNWKEEDFNICTKNVTCFKYDKLGIVKARNTLRKHFLESDEAYDYLIMLDDDCVVTGTPEAGQEYLKQLNEHPDGFGEFNKTLLKLFAISRSLFGEQQFNEEYEPEKGVAFEDRIFVNLLRTVYPDKKFEFNVPGLSESSISTADPTSTWYTNQSLANMRETTNKTIEFIKKTHAEFLEEQTKRIEEEKTKLNEISKTAEEKRAEILWKNRYK